MPSTTANDVGLHALADFGEMDWNKNVVVGSTFSPKSTHAGRSFASECVSKILCSAKISNFALVFLDKTRKPHPNDGKK